MKTVYLKGKPKIDKVEFYEKVVDYLIKEGYRHVIVNVDKINGFYILQPFWKMKGDLRLSLVFNSRYKKSKFYRNHMLLIPHVDYLVHSKKSIFQSCPYAECNADVIVDWKEIEGMWEDGLEFRIQTT